MPETKEQRTPRSRRGVALTLGALIALQASLVLIWRAVESDRSSDAHALAPTSGSAAVKTTRMASPVPDLELRRADGTTTTLREALGAHDTPRLVHVWATWCPPCREELPGLLAYGEHEAVDVLAVSVDQSWEDVREVLGPAPRDGVALARGADVRDALDVHTLPVTFVVGPDGTIRLRLDGARDWEDEALRREVRGD